jgi:hypothetical protein
MKEWHASAVYLGTWVVGIIVLLAAMLGMAWLFLDETPVEDLVCVERPSPPYGDADLEAWLDDPEYVRPRGPDCRYESEWQRDTP